MGKKKYKVPGNNAAKPKPMDKNAMEVFMRGRNAGYESGKADGKMEGLVEMMVMFNDWLDVMDQHVAGIGPRTKEKIGMYFGDCIKEAIEKTKQIENISIEPQTNKKK